MATACTIGTRYAWALAAGQLSISIHILTSWEMHRIADAGCSKLADNRIATLKYCTHDVI